MKFQQVSVFSLTLMMAGATHAADLMFQFGVDLGGDEMGKVVYTNGDTQSIDAGALIYGAFGAVFQTAPESHPELETQLSLGYKFDTASAQNGDVTWSRIPVDALEFYTTPQWRFGGGLTYHLNPTLDGSGFASNVHADFDNALGIILEVDYLTGGNAFIGGRATFIDYTLSNSSASISGNSIGATIGTRF